MAKLGKQARTPLALALAIPFFFAAKVLLHSQCSGPSTFTISTPWSKRQEVDTHSAHRLINSVEAFVFDLDGVIWIGDSLVEGVKKALSDLRSFGKSVVFATNNSKRTRTEVASRLKSMGLDWVMERDVLSAASAAAQLLETKGISKDKEIYIVGEVGLRDEVAARGYRISGGPADAGKSLKDVPAALERINLDSVGAVVCGLDRQFNYYKLAIASYLVRNGRPLYAANVDMYFGKIGSSKQQFPAGGSTLMAIAAAAGRQPPLADAVAGKPSLEFAEEVRHALDCPFQKMVMVGDRLDSDVHFGNSAGMRTLLVLSGETTRADVQRARGKMIPDYVAQSVAVLGSP